LARADRGRREAGRGCWRFSAARPAPGGATFNAHLMDGNPASAFREETQAPQEMRRTSNPRRCPRPSGLFSWIGVARPRECLLEEHCRARHPPPLLSQGQQP